MIKECSWIFRRSYFLSLLLFVASIVNVVALYYIPITPDEISRFALANAWIEGETYDFSWPPMLMAINVLCKYIGGNVYTVRLIFLVIELGALCFLLTKVNFYPSFAWFIVIPYLALILATASPQGLMIPLLLFMVWAIIFNNLMCIFLISFLSYLVNPTCILIFPAAAVMLRFFYKADGRRYFLFGTLLALFSILMISFFVYKEIGIFMPTLTSNGPLNIFLGNNPDPMSYRGVAGGDDWVVFNANQYLKVTYDFLLKMPYQFLENYLLKLVFWFAPFDFIRSGIGGDFQSILFVYVAVVQLFSYHFFIKRIRSSVSYELLVVLFIFIMAWLAYSIFFVKLRFRIPFDFLIFFAAFSRFEAAGQKLKDQ